MKKNMMFMAVFAVFYSLSVVHVGDGVSVAVPAAEAKKEKKVDVCHIPPGNPSNAHTINIDQSAVDAHLAHGDYLGECGAVVVEDNSNDNDSKEKKSKSNDNDSNDNASNGNESKDNDNSSNGNESKDNDNESDDKVDVCHVTVSSGGGSKDKDSGGAQTTSVQTLNISASALQAHLDHGDVAGECPTTPTCFLCGAGGPGDGTCACPDGTLGSFVSGPAATPENIRSIQGK